MSADEQLSRPARRAPTSVEEHTEEVANLLVEVNQKLHDLVHITGVKSVQEHISEVKNHLESRNDDEYKIYVDGVCNCLEMKNSQELLLRMPLLGDSKCCSQVERGASKELRQRVKRAREQENGGDVRELISPYLQD